MTLVSTVFLQHRLVICPNDMTIPTDDQLAPADNPYTEADEEQPAIRDLLDKFAALNEEAQQHPDSEGEPSGDEEGEAAAAEGEQLEGEASGNSDKKKKKKKKSKAAKAVQKLKWVLLCPCRPKCDILMFDPSLQRAGDW